MSFLVDPGATNQALNYTGVQVQTSVWTLPIPVIAGTVKIAPNIVEYTDFEAKDADNGGKGGGKDTGKDYSATVELALCEGEVDSVPLVIVNQNTLKTLSDLGMTLISGTFPDQAPWDYMVQAHPDNAFPYAGTALIVRENYDLGESAAIPNHNFFAVKTSGWLASWFAPSTINATTYPKIAAAFPSGIPTADLALFIQEMLTNPQYGVIGFPSGAINTSTLLSGPNAGTTGDMALQTYLQALGLGYCICLNSQETAQSILGRFLQISLCAGLWSGKSFKFIPYGDEPITGNGVTYLPNLTPVYAFDDDDYVGDSGDDPLIIDRTDPMDAYNVFRVEVTTDDGLFSYIPVEARNQALIEKAGGPRIASTVTGHEIIGQAAGLLIANLLLQQSVSWRNTVTFKLGPEFVLQEPMDLFTAADPVLGTVTYRVTQVDEDDKGELTITAQQFYPGTGTAGSLGGTQTGNPGLPDFGQGADNVNAPVIIEPNSTLADPEIWIAASGSGGTYDPNWGGAQVWLSTDNVNYSYKGDITQPARMGALTANLAAYGGANPDTTNTLSIDLSQSQGTLETVSAGDAANGVTLCYVDGELVSFETATLSTQTASNEAHTIPASGPYNIYVTHVSSWASDGGVVYAAGGSLTYVSGVPTTGQYTLNGVVYVFSAGDAGTAVKITYNYTNPYHYSLTTLYRGLYGTSAGSHLSGAQFSRLDGAVFKTELTPSAIGQTIYAKLVSFNRVKDGIQDISTLTPVTYVPVGTGYGGGSGGVPTTPTGLTGLAKGVTGSGWNSISWNANPSTDNVTTYTILRRIHSSGSYASIGSCGANNTQFNDTTAGTGVTYDYELTATNAAGTSSPDGPISVATN